MDNPSARAHSRRRCGAIAAAASLLASACSSTPPDAPNHDAPPAEKLGKTSAADTAPPDGYTNVALDHVAVASSLASASLASWATDGNIDANETRTAAGDPDPWLAVALRYSRVVDYVDVYGDGVTGNVELLDASFQVVAVQPVTVSASTAYQRVSLPGSPSGSYVRVHGAPGTTVAFSEVQAYTRLIPAGSFPLSQHPSSTDFCWKHTQGRGAGTIPGTCGAGTEQQGALCYPLCASGYAGVGPVCWQVCPSGWTDTGAFCHHDGAIIGADNSACPWYDVCGLTFAAGCSVCPPGYANDGCTCRIDPQDFAKNSYGRSAGSPMGCAAGQDEQAGLCYDACTYGSRGVGPVCWSDCYGDHPADCIAGCATTTDTCIQFLTNATVDIASMLMNIGSMVESFGESAEAISQARQAISMGSDQATTLQAAITKELLDQAEGLNQDVASSTAQLLVNGVITGTIDWTQLDPTGIAAVVVVFNRPMC